MRHSFVAILFAIFFLVGTRSSAQDSLQLISEHWPKLKKAQIDLSNSIVRFVSYTSVRSVDVDLSRKAANDAMVLHKALAPITKLDIPTVKHIEALQDSMLKTVFVLARLLQQNRVAFQKPRVKAEAKKLESFLERLVRQIHDFNYYVHEKGGAVLRFKDLSL